MFDKLYNFRKNSWHCRYFEWVWGIKPFEKYNTMCPYFWSWIATALLTPFILLVKSIEWLIKKPDYGFLEKANNKCKEFSESIRNKIESRKIKKLNKKKEKTLKEIQKFNRKYENNIIEFLNTKDFNKLMETISLMKKESVFVKIKSKKYNSINNILRELFENNFNINYKDFDYYLHNYSFDDIYLHYCRKQKAKTVEKQQKYFEEKANTKSGRIIGSILLAIMIIVSIALVIYVGMYMISLIVFVTKWFIKNIQEIVIYSGIFLGCSSILFLIIWFFHCHGSTIIKIFYSSMNYIVNLLKNIILFIFNPTVGGWIVTFFNTIIKAFVVVANMIHATYKNYCPMITWEKDDNK